MAGHWRKPSNLDDQDMSETEKKAGNLETRENHEKAKEYEPVIDMLLEDGRALENPENGIDISPEQYSRQSPLEKTQTLARFYNNARNLDESPESYYGGEILDYIETIIEEPEKIRSSQTDSLGKKIETGDREQLNQRYETGIVSEIRSRHRTGRYRSEQQMEQVVRELQTDGEKDDRILYFGVEPEQ